MSNKHLLKYKKKWYIICPCIFVHLESTVFHTDVRNRDLPMYDINFKKSQNCLL